MAWQTAGGELFPNQEAKEYLVHGGLARCRLRPRQIHPGLGASGANPKGQVQATAVCACPLILA
jgi:hypothetical protein